ncbi:hypothetical protein IWZ01DRAFT_500645 [Phyllosticta capitalensis]
MLAHSSLKTRRRLICQLFFLLLSPSSFLLFPPFNPLLQNASPWFRDIHVILALSCARSLPVSMFPCNGPAARRPSTLVPFLLFCTIGRVGWWFVAVRL